MSTLLKKMGSSKTLHFFLLYFSLLCLYEFLFRFFIPDVDYHFAPYIFNLSYALLLTIITRSVKPSRIVFFTMSFIVAILYASQVYYYYFFNTFYIAYSVFQAGMVVDSFSNEISILISTHLEVAFAFFVPIVVLMLFTKLLKSTPWSLKKGAIAFILFLVVFGGSLLEVNFRNRDDAVYDALVYHGDVIDSINHLGVLTSLNVDLTRYVREGLGLENANRIPEIIDEEEPEAPSPVFAFNQLDIPFETLIANEKNPTLKAMHEYFYSQNPSQQNEKTGIYKGYNLIYITAETFTRWSVRQDITPTLYKLVNEGYYFPNFYNPLFTVSTSDAEYMGITSMLPKSGVWSLKESSKNDMGFVLGHELKDLGYTTYAFHNNDYKYYRRDLSHPNLGYTFMGVGNGLKDTAEWPQSDYDMMKETIPKFINEDQFHVYYMTVSGHSYWYWRSNAQANKNRDLVKDLPYNSYVQGYLASQIELDKAMEYLLDELEKAGKLDKTLIVLSADHYPYNMGMSYIVHMNDGVKLDTQFEIHRSPLILYTPNIKPETITKSVSSLDLLPTINNLMGIPYDSRLLMGTDIFSNTDPVVIFKDHSFITSVGRYDAKTKQFTYNDGYVQNQTYVNRMIQVVENKFYYSQKFLETNYYKIISQNLTP